MRAGNARGFAGSRRPDDMGKPRPVYVLDLEYQQSPYVYAGGAVVCMAGGGVHTEYLPTIESLVKWTCYNDDRRIAYAHWGSRADFPIILHHAREHGEGARQGLYAGGGLIQFYLRDTLYRDSIKLLIKGVPAIGAAVGLEKTPLPYETLLADSTLGERCEAAANHAEIVLAALARFAEHLRCRIDQLPLTAGAAGIRSLEDHIGDRWPQLTGWAADHAAAAGYGGRTEIHFRGLARRVGYWDINSSYPNQGGSQILPVSDPVRTRHFSTADVITATVHVPECFAPVLPFRYDGALFFPTGTFHGTWIGDELRYAIDCGARVDRVYGMTRFRERLDVRDWFRDLYTLRKSSPFHGLFCKILLNSCVGKWRQHQPNTMIKYDPAGDWHRKAKPLGSDYYSLELESKRPRFQNLAAWGHILAHARIQLHREGIAVAGDRCVMCDTDSVIGAWTPAPDRCGSELGQWGLERAWGDNGLGDILTVANKVYVGYPDGGKPEIVKCKGARKSGNLDRLLALMKGETVSLRGIPTQFQLWQAGVLDFERWDDYHLKLERVKRSYAPDGSSVPFTAAQIVDGAYEEILEDRGIFASLMEIHGAESSHPMIPGIDG